MWGKNINELGPIHEQIYCHGRTLLEPLKYLSTRDSNLTVVILVLFAPAHPTQMYVSLKFSFADK